MTGTLRLFTIEWRRSVALWFFPLMALGGGWYAASLLMNLKVAIWVSTSAHIGLAMVVIAPLMGGVAAWAAGRDKRRGMSDLLATTPRPAPQRNLVAWAGLALWGVLAYVAAGAYDVFVTMRNDPWGEPAPAPIVIGLLTVITGTAIGYLVGGLIPSRFVPPLAPIVLAYAVTLLSSGWFWDDPVSNLSPLSLVETWQYEHPSTVFYVHPPVLLLEASLWLVGLTGVALALVALHWRRTRIAWGVLAVAVAVAATGATLLMSAFENPNTNLLPWERTELADYTPVCVHRSVPVCVHPAFEPLLAGYANRIDLLIEPLVGLPGAPVRAEQLPYMAGMYADGTFAIEPMYGIEMPTVALVQAADEAEPAFIHYNLRVEQAVIATWLAQRVDASAFEFWHLIDGMITDRTQADVDAAVARFSALDPEEQRAWLAANYADLRAGELDLEDLP